jgi:hypothetical protein
MSSIIIVFIIIFFIGLFYYVKYSDPSINEGLTNNNSNKSKCPNLLIQKGARFYLYNSKLAQVPGVNPVEFDNLEDYTEFLDWQRSQGIRCPVLYLQETYDTQGNRVYKARPSVSEPQAGLPSVISPSVSENSYVQNNDSSLAYPNPTLLVDATRNDPPYNTNSYPAYDSTSYYVGTTTPLDVMNIKQEAAKVSPDPMDPNWGGADYTQSLVDKGYYQDNNVQIYT